MQTQIDYPTCHSILHLSLNLNGDNDIVFMYNVECCCNIYILLHQKSWHVGTILSSWAFLRHVRYNNDRGSKTPKTYITTIRYFNGKWANNEDETLKKEDIYDANRKDRNVIISLFLFVLLRLLSNNHIKLS